MSNRIKLLEKHILPQNTRILVLCETMVWILYGA